MLSSLLDWSFLLDDQWTFAKFSIRWQISTKASGLFVCHWKKCTKELYIAIAVKADRWKIQDKVLACQFQLCHL